MPVLHSATVFMDGGLDWIMGGIGVPVLKRLRLLYIVGRGSLGNLCSGQSERCRIPNTNTLFNLSDTGLGVFEVSCCFDMAFVCSHT